MKIKEIKFRGVSILTKQMVSGNLLKDCLGKTYILFDDAWDELRNGNIITDPSGFTEVDPETIGQYSGLKDRTGKEAYTRDKIRDLKIGIEGVIIFDDGCFCVKITNIKKRCCDYTEESIPPLYEMQDFEILNK